jgi:hypothetical protein
MSETPNYPHVDAVIESAQAPAAVITIRKLDKIETTKICGAS